MPFKWLRRGSVLGGRRSVAECYAVAILLACFSVVGVWLGQPLGFRQAVYLLPLLATFMSLLYGGIGPAVITAVGSIVPTELLFVDATHHVTRTGLTRLFVTGAMLLMAFVLRHFYELERDAKELRDKIIAIAAHDLKGPLAASLLAVEVLGRHLKDADAIAKKKLDVIKRSLHREQQLLEYLLDQTRLTHGKLHVAKESVRLDEVVHNIVEDIKDSMGCEIKEYLEPVSMPADKERLEQVVINLIENACKYGGGKEVEVRVLQNGHAQFSVTDHGIGIPTRDQKRVFEPFERGLHSGVAPGHGLGLWIAKQLAELQGGDIEVESSPGEGSTFYFKLPLS